MDVVGRNYSNVQNSGKWADTRPHIAMMRYVPLSIGYLAQLQFILGSRESCQCGVASNLRLERKKNSNSAAQQIRAQNHSLGMIASTRVAKCLTNMLNMHILGRTLLYPVARLYLAKLLRGRNFVKESLLLHGSNRESRFIPHHSLSYGHELAGLGVRC